MLIISYLLFCFLYDILGILDYKLNKKIMNKNSKILYVVATPIGNLKDITYRAVEVLSEVSVIFCEDTRKTSILLAHYGIKNKKLLVFNKDYSLNDIKKAITILKDSVGAIVSDSGTPNISDPASPLISACYKHNIKVIPVPGASSVTAFFSCFPFDGRFIFYGFIDKPSRSSQISNLVNISITADMPIIIFISPSKIENFLSILGTQYPETEVYLAKELTKINEFKEYFLAKDYKSLKKIEGFVLEKGEYCLGLRFKPIEPCKEDIENFIAQNLDKKTKILSQIVSARFNIPVSIAYEKILKYKEICKYS